MTYKVHLESYLPNTPDQQVIVTSNTFMVGNNGCGAYILFYNVDRDDNETPVAFFHADDVKYVETK